MLPLSLPFQLNFSSFEEQFCIIWQCGHLPLMTSSLNYYLHKLRVLTFIAMGAFTQLLLLINAWIHLPVDNLMYLKPNVFVWLCCASLVEINRCFKGSYSLHHQGLPDYTSYLSLWEPDISQMFFHHTVVITELW
jgi:hypothetical protein